MSEKKCETQLDFGDFENYTKVVGEEFIPRKFRYQRAKHANHYALITNFGPVSSEFCRKEELKKAHSKVERSNLDIKNQFVIFSDTNDTVLFNSFEDPQNPFSVMIKSKPIAEFQRAQLKMFSQMIGN